jgi:hypothetical protein
MSRPSRTIVTIAAGMIVAGINRRHITNIVGDEDIRLRGLIATAW